MRTNTIIIIGVLCTFACGCTKSLTGDTNEKVYLIEITSDFLKIATGDTLSLQVIMKNTDGVVLEGQSVVWEVEDTSVVEVSSDNILHGKKEGQTDIRASVEDVYDDLSVEVYDFLGIVLMENQTDHRAVMVSWLPEGQVQSLGGDSEGYVITDSMGYYVLPNMENGDWVVTAEYPYYALDRDTITVMNGKIEGPLQKLYLHQQLAFEVVLDKTEYSIEDTVFVKYKAVNITDDTLVVISLNFPMTEAGYAITENDEPILIELNDGRIVEPYVFYSTGVPATDARTLPPGHSQFEPSGELLGMEPRIELDMLYYEYGAITKGRSYQIYAGYVADWTYPSEYFWMPPNWTANQRLLNYSLYKKLNPVTITIKE